MNFIFYDTETTGLDRTFDQVMQFAAIQTDGELNELDRFETRCQILPWVVPAPIALQITGVTPAILTDCSLPTHFEMMSEIYSKLKSWGPSIYIGYNSMRFDEPLVQRALWQNLLPPFVTVLQGSSRLDLLPLVQACSHLKCEALKFPYSVRGKLVFKLDQLAPLNGFDHSNAHDALSDVEATIHIAKMLSKNAAKIWEPMVRRSSKAATSSVLIQNEPVLIVEHFSSGPAAWFGQRVDGNGNTGTYGSVARLTTDWLNISRLNEVDFQKKMEQSPRPLRRLAMNKAPIVFTLSEARSSFGYELSSFERHQSMYLQKNVELCDKLSNFKDDSQDAVESKNELEQRFFDGFPSYADQSLIKQFHSASWKERAELIDKLQSKTLQRLARRVIFSNRPELLSKKEYSLMYAAISERLLSGSGHDKPCRTLPMARVELNDLDQNAFTESIERWFGQIEEKWSK